MDALKRFLVLVLCTPLLLVVVPFMAKASPPVDLIQQTSQGKQPKEHALTEDDLVYTDVNEALPNLDLEYARMLVRVTGRSLPGRTGKALFMLERGDRVKPLKLSKDKHWLAVGVLKNRRRAWVPRNTVKFPPRTKKKPAQ
jgi:hypothetical protein